MYESTNGFAFHILQINFVREKFGDTQKEWILLVCIGASSGVGRLLFGKIGDLIPGAKKIYMQVQEAEILNVLLLNILWDVFIKKIILSHPRSYRKFYLLLRYFSREKKKPP